MPFPSASEHRAALPRELTLGRLVMVGFLAIFLLRELPSVGSSSGSTRVAVVAAIAVATLTWTWFWWALAATPDRVAHGIAVGLMLATATTLVVMQHIGVFPFYYAVIVAGAAYRWRIGALLALVVATVAVVVWWRIDRSTGSLQVPVIIALLGGAAVTVRRYIAAQLALDETREQLRGLAANEARAQLARDVHDKVGQQLTAAVMHSELLAMDAAEQPKLQQRADLIVKTARDALALMREMITGVREPSLRAEVEVAKTMLEAAGITCAVQISDVPLPTSVDSVFGWVVREGSTNILRHSGASVCRIALASPGRFHVLTIHDDGHGGPTPGHLGNGLTHMRERLATVNGALAITNEPNAGFLLTARAGEAS